MPRHKRVLQPDYPYHVTLRSINRMNFGVDMNDLWSFSSDLLLFCSYAFKIEIHAFVLMNNHYHLLVRTPLSNLEKFMNYFNRMLSWEISNKTGRINQKFGARYHPSIISDLSYYHNVYKYIYRNPVEAQICEKVETYNYSSLNFVLGREKYRFPVFDPYFGNIEDHWPNLNWLNTPYESSEYKEIRMGLRKTHFSTISAISVPATSATVPATSS